MKLLPALAGLCFLAVGSLVGVRLLLLARRTRRAPEGLLGAGLTSLTFVTLPAIGMSLVARVGSPELGQVLFLFGLMPLVGFAACLYAFTSSVFRPQQPAAWLVTLAATLLAALALSGMAVSRIAAWSAERVVSGSWGTLLLSVFALGLAWTGVEAGLYHRRLRRRLSLGLADPVVTDRFWLWCWGSLGAALGTLVVGASMALGLRAVAHPLPILGATFAGLCLSASWYLAFFPPAFYRRRISARSLPQAA